MAHDHDLDEGWSSYDDLTRFTGSQVHHGETRLVKLQ